MPAENVDYDRFTDPPRPKAQPRFTLVPFNQIRRRQTSAYLIKGLIGATGLIVAWGPPKCGKSFWVFDAVMHIALGWEYRGRRVTQGNVVYLALEGQDGFADRVDAFRQQRFEDGVGDVPGFYLVKDRTDLVKDTAELIKCIQSQCTTGKPAVVVIDTMNRSLVGSDSRDEDMAAYIKAADIDQRDLSMRRDHHPSLRDRRNTATRPHLPHRRCRRPNLGEEGCGQEHHRHGRLRQGHARRRGHH